MNSSHSKFITKLGLVLIALPALAVSAGGSLDPVSVETASRVAVNQVNRMRILEARNSRDPQEQEKRMAQILAGATTVREAFTESKDGTPVYHILNLHPQGWAIVAADHVAYPVIGYSTTGSYRPGRRNCGFEDWMKGVREEIHAAISRKLSPTLRALQAWNDLDRPSDLYLAEGSSFRATAAAAPSVAPLLSTIWGQGSNQPGIEPCATWLVPWLIGYDAYCPYEKNWAGYYQVAPTGCVATAMGQVMKYWSWPPRGEGTYTGDPPYEPLTTCITESTYGPYTVNYAERTYDWGIMPNDVWPMAAGLVPASTYEVAKLLRDVGNAVDMMYTPTGSGAYPSSIPGALKSHFRYATSTVCRYRSSYAATWIEDLKNELSAGRPVVYGAAAPDGTGGHEFVLDGYDASGNFHINWGWEGWLDGYFNVDSLTVFDLLSLSTHDFTAYHSGIFFMKPDYPPTAQNDSYSMDWDLTLEVAASGVLGNDSDPWGDALAAAVETWPGHGTLSLYSNGGFRYTPTPGFMGTDTFTYTASDGRYSSSAATVTITVLEGNHAPVLAAVGNQSANEGQLLQFTLSASDQDGNALTYSATGLPTGAAFDPATRTFSWTPSYSQAGLHSGITFTVSDNGAPVKQDSETVTITVANVNRAPVLEAIGNRTVNEGQTLQFTVSGIDPDGDPVTYGAAGLPGGASFDPASRTFSWTPTYTQSGTYPGVAFSLADNGSPALLDDESITITVVNVNRAPAFSAVNPKQVNEGQNLQFTVAASDPDGDALGYSATALPAGASFNPATRTFSWTPKHTQAGSHVAGFRALDNGQPPLSGLLDVAIQVIDVPTPREWVERLLVEIGQLHESQWVKSGYASGLSRIAPWFEAGQPQLALRSAYTFRFRIQEDLNKGVLASKEDAALFQLTDRLIQAIQSQQPD